MAELIVTSDITGVVLAGGLSSRMGGLDKGLQLFNGVALVAHAIARLQAQLHHICISANRHLDAYKSFGFPVLTDAASLATDMHQAPYQGPLAGFLAGLEYCHTPFLLTVPCDTPLFPMDLVQRLSTALEQSNADIAMASSPDETGQLCSQSVFCLLRCEGKGDNASLADNLRQFLADGGRQIGAWTAQHNTVNVAFDLPHDHPHAFANLNTLNDVQMLQQQLVSST